MSENLRTTHYNNGEEITFIFNDFAWGSSLDGQYGDYSNVDTYGYIYNWAAAANGTEDGIAAGISNNGGICPEYFHVPTDEEWMELEMELGMSGAEANSTFWRGTNEGSKLAGNHDLWFDHNGGIKDDEEFGSSGFLALPSGTRDYNFGFFEDRGERAYFWTSSAASLYTAWNRILMHTGSDIFREGGHKSTGGSIRCVADGIIQGCTNADAYNYNSEANVDNGSCGYCPENFSQNPN